MKSLGIITRRIFGFCLIAADQILNFSGKPRFGAGTEMPLFSFIGASPGLERGNIGQLPGCQCPVVKNEAD
jgi:hypothetical protein